jgi:hypothetical protein
MRVLHIKSCSVCPYFEQTNGYNKVWVCRHRQFRGGINDPRRKNDPWGKLLKTGGYPRYVGKRVADGCPLEKV